MTQADDYGDTARRSRFAAALSAVRWWPAFVVALACAYPFAGFLATNRNEPVSVVSVVAYAAGVALVSIAGLVVMRLLFPRLDTRRAAVALAVFIVLFFNYARFASLPFPFGGWLIAAALGVVAGYALARFEAARLYLVILLVMLAGFPTVQFALHKATADSTAAVRAKPGRPLAATEKPNIWFFMLDGYARADQAQRVLEHDNRGFEDDLRERGFAVNQRTYTPYSHTIASVPSMLEMDYVATGVVDGGEQALVPALRGRNRLVARLKASGYQYVHTEPGTWAGNRCPRTGADACVPPQRTAGIAIGEVEQSIINLTPAYPLLRAAGVSTAFDTGFSTPEHILSGVRRAAPRQPFFVFGHILSPHPPHRFRADCSTYSEAHRSGWNPKFKHLYVDELRCLNQRMIPAIDRIVADDPEAVIVILSDHGTAFGLGTARGLDTEKDAARWTQAELEERFAAFSAVRLPERCPQDENTFNATVNTFRVVLACIENRAPDLLDYRAFVVQKQRHELHMDEVKRGDWPPSPGP